MFLIIALSIPFELQFGVERRAYIVILSLAVGAVTGLFLALDHGLYIAAAIQRGMRALISFPALWVILAASYLLSVIIMERKDF